MTSIEPINASKSTKVQKTTNVEDMQIEKITEELISTEADYLRSLHFLQTQFLSAIHEIVINANHKEGRRTSQCLRECVSEMHALGTTFLNELSNASDPELIGIVFITNKNLLDVYSRHCRYWVRYQRLIKNYQPTSTAIKKIEEKLEQPLSFDIYTMKPIQRLAKYELLLNRLLEQQVKRIKRGENVQIDYLQQACGVVKRALHACNTNVALHSMIGNRFNISESGNFITRFNMIVLLKHPQPGEVLLFRKMIVIALIVENSLLFHDFIRIDHLRKTDCQLDDQLVFVLEDYNALKTMKRRREIPLKAKSKLEKNKCIEAIDKLLWSQLQHLKEMTTRAHNC